MKFSYQFFRGAYYPIVPVEIVNGSKNIATSAVVDSGAFFSVFSGSAGRELGLDVEKGEKRIFQAASAKLVGYIHEVVLVVAGEEIICKVAFSDELSTSFNLLGRYDVFKNFMICFDESEKSVEFTPK